MLDETRASRVNPGDKIRGQAPSEGEFPGAWIWCLVNWVVPAEEGWWCHLMGIRRGDLRWLLLKEIWDDRLLLKAQQSQSTQCLPLMSLATSWDIYSSHNPIKTCLERDQNISSARLASVGKICTLHPPDPSTKNIFVWFVCLLYLLGHNLMC